MREKQAPSRAKSACSSIMEGTREGMPASKKKSAVMRYVEFLRSARLKAVATSGREEAQARKRGIKGNPGDANPRKR